MENLTDQDKQFLRKLKDQGIGMDEAMQRLQGVKSKLESQKPTAEKWSASAQAGMAEAMPEKKQNPIARRLESTKDIAETLEEHQTGGSGIKGKLGRGLDRGVNTALAVGEGAIEMAADVAIPAAIGVGKLGAGILKKEAEIMRDYTPAGLAYKATKFGMQKGAGAVDDLTGGALTKTKDYLGGKATDIGEAGVDFVKDATEDVKEQWNKLDPEQQALMKSLGYKVEGLMDMVGGAGAKEVAEKAGIDSVETLTRKFVDEAGSFGKKIKDEGFEIQNLTKEVLDEHLPAIISKTDEILGGLKPDGTKFKEGVSKKSMYALVQQSGLEEKTIRFIAKNPELFTKVQAGEVNIDTLGRELYDAVATLRSEVSSHGAGYKDIKAGTDTFDVPVSKIDEMLGEHGLMWNGDDLVETGHLSSGLAKKDIDSIGGLVGLVAETDTMSGSQLINLRKQISAAMKFDSGIGSEAQGVLSNMRKVIDNVAKDKIPGLKELDKAYSKAREEYDALFKDYFNKKTGNFKDTALSKLANLTKFGKGQVLDRVKKVIPDIADKIDAVEAMRDLQRSISSHKTGAYAKTGLALAGLASGNVQIAIGAGLAAVLGNPETVANLVKSWALKNNKKLATKADDLAKKVIDNSLSDEEAKIVGESVVDALGGKADNTISDALKLKPDDVKKPKVEAKKKAENKTELKGDVTDEQMLERYPEFKDANDSLRAYEIHEKSMTMYENADPARQKEMIKTIKSQLDSADDMTDPDMIAAGRQFLEEIGESGTDSAPLMEVKGWSNVDQKPDSIDFILEEAKKHDTLESFKDAVVQQDSRSIGNRDLSRFDRWIDARDEGQESFDEFVENYAGEFQYWEKTYGKEAIDAIRDNMDKEMITIYRAHPTGSKIEGGDWVAITEDYAAGHLKNTDGDAVVDSITVPRKDVYNANTEPEEWIYAPELPEGVVTLDDIYEKAKDFKKVGKPEASLISEAKKFDSAEEFVQSQPKYYHGSEQDFKDFDFDLTGTASGETPVHDLKGAWLVDNKDVAKGYAGDNGFIKESAIDTSNFHMIDAKGKTLNDFRDEVWEAKKLTKEEGRDGLIIKNLVDNADYTKTDSGNHIFVVNKNSIKTESQLRSIYKQAHK